MNKWPKFNEHGDLPVGIYRATLTEVFQHFGEGTAQRCIVARRLQRIYSEVVKTGHLYRFIIFGSFITEKPIPNDLDIFILMDNSFDVRELPVGSAVLFNHMVAQNYEGASIFWMRRLSLLEEEEKAIEYWQLKRNGTKRGIVEVIKND
jgi:hypothetical protein